MKVDADIQVSSPQIKGQLHRKKRASQRKLFKTEQNLTDSNKKLIEAKRKLSDSELKRKVA